QFTYGTPQDLRLTVRFFERFGSYYNGRLNEFRVRASYRPNEHLSFSAGPQWNRFRLPISDGNFSVVFGALETDYAFSRFLSRSTILQIDTPTHKLRAPMSDCDGTTVPIAIFT